MGSGEALGLLGPSVIEGRQETRDYGSVLAAQGPEEWPNQL